jgi:hypothetical protein
MACIGLAYALTVYGVLKLFRIDRPGKALIVTVGGMFLSALFAIRVVLSENSLLLPPEAILGLGIALLGATAGHRFALLKTKKAPA